jgi:hypothetical protein
MTEPTPLGAKMRALAGRGHRRADELRAAADNLDEAAASGNVPRAVGAWARARRLWCECSGERLI